MSDTRMLYFKEKDILHLAITNEQEAGSIEIGHGITAELNESGELIGIEILNASRFIRDAFVDTVQARVLQLLEAQPA
ncbi:MAG: DUF2283 domain-containing protein [Caldilineales bacterium]|nr:DUF2283 domain-containing protein [Caldilineales bacterium]